MCDKELLVAYIYDEIGEADRARYEAHLGICADCRAELDAMRSVRVDLRQWAPAQPDLDFRVVRDRRPAWTAYWRPAVGLAAAAVLVLAVSAAIANVQVRYGQDGVTIGTGWRNTPAPAVSAPLGNAAALAAPSNDALRAQYAALERRLRQLESAVQTSDLRKVSTVPPLSDKELRRRVSDLIAQSESRQQQELAFRIAQVIHDVDAQRAADLARIQQGLGRIDAMTSAEAAAHRDLANYIITSQRQQR